METLRIPIHFEIRLCTVSKHTTLTYTYKYGRDEFVSIYRTIVSDEEQENISLFNIIYRSYGYKL